jgi:hypothetical protein
VRICNGMFSNCYCSSIVLRAVDVIRNGMHGRFGYIHLLLQLARVLAPSLPIESDRISVMDLPAIFKTILAKSLAHTLVDGQTILPYHCHARPRTDNPQPQCIPMDCLSSPRMARHSILTHNTHKIVTPWRPIRSLSAPYLINISTSAAPTQPKLGHNIINYPINELETYRALSWA